MWYPGYRHVEMCFFNSRHAVHMCSRKHQKWKLWIDIYSSVIPVHHHYHHYHHHYQHSPPLPPLPALTTTTTTTSTHYHSLSTNVGIRWRNTPRALILRFRVHASFRVVNVAEYAALSKSFFVSAAIGSFGCGFDGIAQHSLFLRVYIVECLAIVECRRFG